MAIFDNPNDPTQPCRGVYAWYAYKDCRNPITIYIGRAGQTNNFRIKGTLFRGISELQRNTFTSNYNQGYNALDTDFIVGTVILFFEKNGFQCVWKHIHNDPSFERSFVEVQQPILQNNIAKIKEEFRLRNPQEGYWSERRNTREGMDEATNGIFLVLDNLNLV